MLADPLGVFCYQGQEIEANEPLAAIPVPRQNRWLTDVEDGED